MFDLINPIDTALRPIEELHCLALLALPHLKAVWQVVTAEKTQRILRAICLAVLVLGTWERSSSFGCLKSGNWQCGRRRAPFGHNWQRL
jgi:hypothetical protein